MRAYNGGVGWRKKTRTQPFLIRYGANPIIDRNWDMEDKDLSG